MITLSKFSSSIEYIDKMFLRRRNYYWDMTEAVFVCLFVIILFIWLAIKMYKDKMRKFHEQFKILDLLKDK